jgi:hypothetical protein
MKLSFAEKWMGLGVTMLSEISRAEKASVTCSRSCVEPRLEMVAVVVGHGCKWGTLCRLGGQEGERKGH